ncbi:MAPEG family protein [Novosphingobium sp.]|uniref:MAPEG family protein n=1 Tax=Novosphingobium sp. TaxID=1874826 RepID=UPI002B47A0FF|nr:MAPEG family protein [Novosphingobium sp.]HKR93576.1 MAPEG family protein [Novosphingobium sp.]
MILQTTLSLAAAAAVINLWLMTRIARLRVGSKVLHGDGGNPLLAQRMRAQLNFIENTPLVLILIAGIEMTGKGGAWLAIVGAVYMLGRVLHPLGMDRTDANVLRGGGILITMLTLLGLSVMAVLIALGRF